MCRAAAATGFRSPTGVRSRIMAAMKVLADSSRTGQMIDQLAGRVGRAMADVGDWALVGIRRRGDLLARRLAETLEPTHVGSVDITLYRDDLSEVGPQPVVRTTEIDFDPDGRTIVLVDDVLMTGRSVRAAIQSLIDFGRPRCIRLAVLVDRGGRELPICPDFVGESIEAGAGQHVRVELQPLDAADRIVIMQRPDASR